MTKHCATCLHWHGTDTQYNGVCDEHPGKTPFNFVCPLYVASAKQVLRATEASHCTKCQGVWIEKRANGMTCVLCGQVQ